MWLLRKGINYSTFAVYGFGVESRVWGLEFGADEFEPALGLELRGLGGLYMGSSLNKGPLQGPFYTGAVL